MRRVGHLLGTLIFFIPLSSRNRLPMTTDFLPIAEVSPAVPQGQSILCLVTAKRMLHTKVRVICRELHDIQYQAHLHSYFT